MASSSDQNLQINPETSVLSDRALRIDQETLTSFEGLYFKQCKCKTPEPDACWAPWFLNFYGLFADFVYQALHEVSFLEYIVLVRCKSSRRTGPTHNSTIIFMKENCTGKTCRPQDIYVEYKIYDFIDREKSLENMFLFLVEEGEEQLLRDNRVEEFRKLLADKRSEAKLTSVVGNFVRRDAIVFTAR
jgi:hypothetical protein